MTITKQALLSALATGHEDVPIDGLAEPVRIRIMSGLERDAALEILKGKIGQSIYYAAMIMSCIINEDGSPMFTADEVVLLQEGHGELAKRIANECERVNAIGRVAIEAAKKLRESGERRFQFRLALAFGKTRHELMRSMSSVEFAEWLAFYELEPFGERIKDLRMGTLAALIANINRNTKKKKKPFVPVDFAHWMVDGEPKEASAPILLQDKKAQSNAIRASLFGRRIRRADAA